MGSPTWSGKVEVEMWKRVKDLDDKKQALAVFDLALDLVLALSLKGRAQSRSSFVGGSMVMLLL